MLHLQMNHLHQAIFSLREIMEVGVKNYLNLLNKIRQRRKMPLWKKNKKGKKGKWPRSTALLSVWLIRPARPYYANSCWSITTYCIKCTHKPLAFMVNRLGLRHRLRCPVGAWDEWTESLDRKHSILCCKAAATLSIHLPIISSINSSVYKMVENRRGNVHFHSPGGRRGCLFYQR